MTEERDDVVVLIDEDGQEMEFEHLDTIEMNGSEYVVLLPLDQYEEGEEKEEDEIIILKIMHGDDGEDSFVSVDDEEELSAVFEEFKLRMEEYYDDEDEE